MDTREYELVVLALTGSDGKKVAAEVEKAIGEHGKVGEVTGWGVKSLAYPIKKQTQADFFSVTLTLPSDGIVSLDKMLRLNQGVLRHLLIKKESEKSKSMSKKTVKQKKVVSKKTKVIKTKVKEK